MSYRGKCGSVYRASTELSRICHGGRKSTISEVAALLIESIWASRGKYITKSEFLGRFVHIFDADLLDKCISTLVQAELIKMKLDGMIEGYVVTDKCKMKFDLK